MQIGSNRRGPRIRWREEIRIRSAPSDSDLEFSSSDDEQGGAATSEESDDESEDLRLLPASHCVHTVKLYNDPSSGSHRVR